MWQGLAFEVFAQILNALSGAKVTRPGKFRSSQDGYAVRSSLKAEDGVLYPLEKGFFFLLLIDHGIAVAGQEGEIEESHDLAREIGPKGEVHAGMNMMLLMMMMIEMRMLMMMGIVLAQDV